KPAAQQHGIAGAQRYAGFAAIATGRIEIGIDEIHRVEVNLVQQVHVVDARLQLESSGLDAETAFDIVRGLGFQVERLDRSRKCADPDPFIDVWGAERARGAGEHRETV